ncbi:hypothetical protein CEXT_235181 [Caerostris extrusa]|uniref:Uncharacterized protein n=1 Tax=Caerostris extrusa TaxID=172846 RepID=A0AAV4WCY4_CAEEX|nr:hypothetical protein CEXT_235181 [Caerostris extrusa]
MTGHCRHQKVLPSWFWFLIPYRTQTCMSYGREPGNVLPKRGDSIAIGVIGTHTQKHHQKSSLISMHQSTNSELADMHLTYDLSDGNG